jgi:hypothetical protein
MRNPLKMHGLRFWECEGVWKRKKTRRIKGQWPFVARLLPPSQGLRRLPAGRQGQAGSASWSDVDRRAPRNFFRKSCQ